MRGEARIMILLSTAISVVCAQDPAASPAFPAPAGGLERWGDSVGPEAPSPLAFVVDDGDQNRRTSASPAARRFVADHPGWRVLFDPRSGMPWRSFGPGIPVARSGAAEHEIAAAARIFAAELHARWSLPGDVPEIGYIGRGGRLWYVSFRQAHRGVRATNAGLTLRIDTEGRLVLWGGRFPRADTSGEFALLAEADARMLAVAHLRARGLLADGSAPRLALAELVRHAPLERPNSPAYLVYRLRLSADRPRAEWEIYVDARDGAVREFWNDIRHAAACGERASSPHLPHVVSRPRGFVAAVTSVVHEGLEPWQTAVATALPDCAFQAAGATYVTDATGGFSFGGASPVSVQSSLDGPWITTFNQAVGGTQAYYSAFVATGALNVLWDDSVSTQSERDAFYFGVRARNRVLQNNPTETLFNTALPVNVGLVGACDAFYDGVSINFSAASGACSDTAFSSTVVQHEYGHHVTATIYAAHGRIVPGHLGEGFSDLQAATSENVSQVGKGLLGPGTFVRDLDNTCRWPFQCGVGIHARGKVTGGAWWKARQNRFASGGANGRAAVDAALYAHFHGTPETETESCLELLLLDDDDADLSDGTPHLADYYDAFTTAHGVPFPIPPIRIEHATLGDTADQWQPIHFRAEAVSISGSTIVGATCFYAVNGSAFTALAMTSSGPEWTATLPRPPTPAIVSYYFRFVDALGTAVYWPSAAPDGVFTFRTYRPVVVFEEGFDGAVGNWSSAATSGTNDWQFGAPGAAAFAFDPPAAFSGGFVAGTDLAPNATFDGIYAPNVVEHLTSPAIDCTGRAFVALDYRRWLSVEDGAFDQARILVSVNNGAFVPVWNNVASITGDDHHLDFAWARHVVRLTAADGQPSVRVRFELASDAGINFGGWNIDHLRIDASPPSPPLTSVGSTATGQQLAVQVRGGAGEGFILCADVVYAPTFVPYVGAISIDPYGPTFVFVVPPDLLTVPSGGLWAGGTIVPPGLSGSTLHLQAVFASVGSDPYSVSNVLSLTFQ